MTRDEYEQKLEALEREIAALRRENVEDEPMPPHQRPEPKEGDMYYYISADGFVLLRSWFGAPRDDNSRAIGNVFAAEEAAEFAVERLKVLAEMREWAGRWNDEFTLRYNETSGVEILTHYLPEKSYGEMRFATKEDAINCIKTVGEDRIKKYYFMISEDEADDD